MKSSTILLVACFISLSMASCALADEDQDLLANSAATPADTIVGQIQDAVKKEIENRLQALEIPGLKLDLKAFESNDNGTSYGLTYDYSFSRKNELDLLTLEADKWYGDWALDFTTKGNVAFQKDVNPMDFLEASFALRGLATLSTGKYSDVLVGSSLIQVTRDAADCTTASIRDQSCVAFNTVKEIMEISLGLQTTLHYGLNVGYEADQEFDATQDKIGAFMALTLFDAREASMLGKLNLLDYPFALLRNLTGRARCGEHNICFEPSGRSFPLLLVALDKVNPDAATPRAMLGDNSDYLRVNVEAAFNTPVGYWQGVDVYFTASYRYYQELDASEMVEAAGLDNSTLITLTVGGRDGMFVSYAKGELPFGIERDETIELGWKWNF